MAIVLKKNIAVLKDIIGVEEAEILLEWLNKHPKGKVDLSACTHLHAANLQVLMAAKPTIVAQPGDTSLAEWLDSAFNQQ